MRLFRRVNYQVPRGEQTGEAFERIRKVVGSLGQAGPSLLFLVEGYAPLADKSIPGIARITAAFPDLARYEFTRERLARQKRRVTWQVLSNLPGSWPESSPHGQCSQAPAEVLGGLADGVPRRFPVLTAAFLFDGVQWPGSGEQCSEWTVRYPPSGRWWDDYLSPSVGLRSDTGSAHGRDLWLEATVEVEPPAQDQAGVPALDPATREVLGRLGDVLTQQFIAAPSTSERERLDQVAEEAGHLVAEVKRSLQPSPWSAALSAFGLPPRRGLSSIPLPFKLGAYEHVPAGPVSFKPTLLEAIGPRGYSYVSALGRYNAYVFTKRTSAHHRVHLCFSTGVRGDVLRCDFAYEGPFLRYPLELYCSPWQLQGEYPIRSPDVLAKAVANYAAVIDHMEEALLPGLDALFGPAPAWFRYEGEL